MPFRSKDVALRSQVEDLEEELEAVRRENAALKASGTPEPALSRTAWMSIGTAAFLAAVATVALMIDSSENDSIAIVLVPIALLVTAAVVSMLVFTRFVLLAGPNEVLVISGRAVRAADGSVRAYRLVRGGRAFRLPIVERVDRMGVQAMALEVTVSNAFAKGGAFDLVAAAVVRVAADEPLVHNAVERFLGRDRQEIAKVAQQTLEGVLRAMVAQLTLEQLSKDGLMVAERVMAEVDEDFGRLGLELDGFKILKVEPLHLRHA